MIDLYLVSALLLLRCLYNAFVSKSFAYKFRFGEMELAVKEELMFSLSVVWKVLYVLVCLQLWLLFELSDYLAKRLSFPLF